MPLPVSLAVRLHCCVASQALSVDESNRLEIKMFEGNSLFLSLLHFDDRALVQTLLSLLTLQATDHEASREIRMLGGIPLLISFLADLCNHFRWRRDHASAPAQSSAVLDVSVVATLCCLLTQLALDGDNAVLMRTSNGVCFLGRLLLGCSAVGRAGVTGAATSAVSEAEAASVSAHILRTLRFIFSLERNRKVFKRLFPPHVFELFIDVGHYAYELALYERLALACVELSTAERSGIDGALDEIDLAKGEAQRMVGEYAVVEMVGQGAFGCIYHARKGGLVYAMKEVPIESYGKVDGGSPSQVEANVGTLHSEVEILSTLDHPNIVKCDRLGSAVPFPPIGASLRGGAWGCARPARCRTAVLRLRYSSRTLATRYYTSFVEKRKLYIVMELVDGVTLGSFLSDHANHSNGADSPAIGLPEKLIWQIFLQVRLPL